MLVRSSKPLDDPGSKIRQIGNVARGVVDRRNGPKRGPSGEVMKLHNSEDTEFSKSWGLAGEIERASAISEFSSMSQKSCLQPTLLQASNSFVNVIHPYWHVTT